MPKDKGWIVTTSPDRPIAEIAKDLKEAGFSVNHVNEEINSVSGSAAEEALAKLRGIRGVLDVSEDVPIDIGPPDSPETW
jgi:predicted CoA-binding protein